MTEHYIGEIFENEYPFTAACFVEQENNSGNLCVINEICPLDEIKRYRIEKIETPSEEEITKKQKQARITELQAFLNSTDWYCSRYVDIGTPIPDDIKQQRSDARIEIDRLRHELEPVADEVNEPTEPQLDDEPTD